MQKQSALNVNQDQHFQQKLLKASCVKDTILLQVASLPSDTPE